MTKPMMKAPAITKRSTKKRLEVDVQFMTYVFGGGVIQEPDPNKPSKPFDPVTPVRSASVRGQLRYWWRATIGARCESLAAMKKREAEVWGAIWSGEPQHGEVGLTVDCHGIKPNAVNTFFFPKEHSFGRAIESEKDIEYIAFPLRPAGRGERRGQDARSAVWDYSGQSFKVALDYPAKFEQDVILALSAWLTFGGFGARTSRGFGAVKKRTGPDTVVSHPDELFSMLDRRGPIRVEGVPAISLDRSRCKMLRGEDTPREAWAQVVKRMRTFRQGVRIGRNEGQERREGRSRWPEADAIRRITGDYVRKHKPVHAGGNAFPRADFGLPIIFHFKDRGDPKDATLKPSKDSERAPSPLIIRSTSKNEPMVLWLVGADVPEDLYLDGAREYVTKSVAPSAPLREHESRLVRPNAIEAFLEHFDSPLEPT